MSQVRWWAQSLANFISSHRSLLAASSSLAADGDLDMCLTESDAITMLVRIQHSFGLEDYAVTFLNAAKLSDADLFTCLAESFWYHIALTAQHADSIAVACVAAAEL